MIPEQAFGHNFVKIRHDEYQPRFVCAKCGCYVYHIASEDKDMWGSLFRIKDNHWMGFAPSITCEEVVIKSIMES
jgi:hypothetical protein